MGFQAVLRQNLFVYKDLRHEQLQQTFVDYIEMFNVVVVSQNSIE